jgi:hypothetical protein
MFGTSKKGTKLGKSMLKGKEKKKTKHHLTEIPLLPVVS